MRELIIKKLEAYACGDVQWLKPLTLCTNEELLELYTDIVQKEIRSECVGEYL